METKSRTWTRAASLLFVALAALLAPVLAAEPALAASSNVLDEGGSTFTDFTNGGDQVSWGGTYDYNCQQASFCDSHGAPVAAAFKNGGKPFTDLVVFCFLDTRNGSNITCTQTGTATVDGFASYPGINGNDFAIQVGVQRGYYAGMVCVGDGRTQAPDGSTACNVNLSPSDPNYGHPRAKYDMGHAGEAGKPATTLPGQQDDGSVDPVACVQQTVSDATNGQFDPVAFILSPVKCAFLWATVMPTKTIPDLVQTQSDNWNATSLGKTVNAVDFYNAFSVDNSCAGVTLPFHLLRVPGGPAPDDIHILATCDSGGLTPVANIVKLGLTVSVLLGGAFALVRMITEFVRGPSLAPAHKSDFEDVLWGK